MNHSLLMKKVNCRRLGRGGGGGGGRRGRRGEGGGGGGGGEGVCCKLSVKHSETKQNHMNPLCCCEQT